MDNVLIPTCDLRLQLILGLQEGSIGLWVAGTSMSHSLVFILRQLDSECSYDLSGNILLNGEYVTDLSVLRLPSDERVLTSIHEIDVDSEAITMF